MEKILDENKSKENNTEETDNETQKLTYDIQ